MAFGYEIDFNSLDGKTVKGTLDIVFTGIGFVLIGLLIRVRSGKAPFWYPWLEQMLGFGFVATAIAMVFVLPLSWEAAKIYFAYYFFEIALYYILPGKLYEGLPNTEQGIIGRRLYKCNGLFAFIITLAVYFYGGVYGKWWSLTIIYDHFPALLNTVNVWAISLTVLLYLKGMIAPSNKFEKNTTGNLVYDLWEGIELNPEIFGFDLKFWSESRPGLIGWVLIDCSLAAYQFQHAGALSVPVLLIAGFHFCYVLDYFLFENYIVTTWDIAFEKFGFMLVWGDYAWVPFFYSFPMWLVLDNTDISDSYASLCFVVFAIGYLIFRGANRQKHLFKTWMKGGQKAGEQMGGGFFFNQQPRVYLPPNGGKLLVSGWWGLARHMNYTGDLLIALAFGMPCGVRYGLLSYTHFIFMIGLLLHRFARDDEKCFQKYGKGWLEYCRLVPYKLIPNVL